MAVKTFIIKASWRSTAKLLKIEARSAEEALLKAERSRQTKGAMTIKVIGCRFDIRSSQKKGVRC